MQDSNSKYLLIEERAGGTIVLYNPSGRWEAGETLAETAAREAAEESGVIFAPEWFLGSYVTMHTALSGQRVCTVRFAFGATLVPGLPLCARDPGILDVHWLTYNEVTNSRSRHRSSAVLRCIDDFRAGHRYPLDAVNHMIDS